MKGRRLLPISWGIFLRLFSDGNEFHLRVDRGLPKDTQLVTHSYDVGRDQHYLVVESTEWDPVEPGNLLPEIIVQFSDLLKRG